MFFLEVLWSFVFDLMREGKDSGHLFFLGDHYRDTPLSLCGLEPIWIKTSVTNVSYINLRFDLRTELLIWAANHGL